MVLKWCDWAYDRFEIYTHTYGVIFRRKAKWQKYSEAFRRKWAPKENEIKMNESTKRHPARTERMEETTKVRMVSEKSVFEEGDVLFNNLPLKAFRLNPALGEIISETPLPNL